jgi:exodeoxyribonuclease VII small subunit
MHGAGKETRAQLSLRGTEEPKNKEKWTSKEGSRRAIHDGVVPSYFENHCSTCLRPCAGSGDLRTAQPRAPRALGAGRCASPQTESLERMGKKNSLLEMVMGKKKSASGETKTVTFEQALGQLEQSVAKLEDGQLGLSEALGQYATGIKNLKQCYRLLEQAERKIELLNSVDQEGRPSTQAFDEEGMSLQEKQESRSRRRSGPGRPAVGGSSSPDIDDPPALF